MLPAGTSTLLSLQLQQQWEQQTFCLLRSTAGWLSLSLPMLDCSAIAVLTRFTELPIVCWNPLPPSNPWPPCCLPRASFSAPPDTRSSITAHSCS